MTAAQTSPPAAPERATATGCVAVQPLTTGCTRRQPTSETSRKPASHPQCGREFRILVIGSPDGTRGKQRFSCLASWPQVTATGGPR